MNIIMPLYQHTKFIAIIPTNYIPLRIEKVQSTFMAMWLPYKTINFSVSVLYIAQSFGETNFLRMKLENTFGW